MKIADFFHIVLPSWGIQRLEIRGILQNHQLDSLFSKMASICAYSSMLCYSRIRLEETKFRSLKKTGGTWFWFCKITIKCSQTVAAPISDSEVQNEVQPNFSAR